MPRGSAKTHSFARRSNRRRQTRSRENKVNRSRRRGRKETKAKNRAEVKVRIQQDIALRRMDPGLSANFQHINSGGQVNLWPNTILPRHLTSAGAFDSLVLQPFWNMNQGFGNDEMIGDTINSKKIKMKFRIDWPQAGDIIAAPVKLYLVHGWVTAPYAASNSTVPSRDDVRPNTLHTHVQQQVQEYFDSKRDVLDFTERSTSNIKILGYQKMEPKGTQIISQIGQDAQYPQVNRAFGAPTYLTKVATWNVGRRIVYSEGGSGELCRDEQTDTVENLPERYLTNWYPNNQWLPFACVYNPDFDSMEDAQGSSARPNISYNVAHYFTDM